MIGLKLVFKKKNAQTIKPISNSLFNIVEILFHFENITKKFFKTGGWSTYNSLDILVPEGLNVSSVGLHIIMTKELRFPMIT